MSSLLDHFFNQKKKLKQKDFNFRQVF